MEGTGQGRASTPQGGYAGPGPGHRRASEEVTQALGEGPSLAACTLGRRHRQVAQPCAASKLTHVCTTCRTLIG